MLPLTLLLAALQHETVRPAADEPYRPRVAEASAEGREALARFRVPDGFTLALFAAEPLLANPVCLALDPHGRVYVAETFRHHKGVTDMREHMEWLEDDIAALTVEDRVAMFRNREGDERFRALYCVEHERVRRIVDADGDGVAEGSTVFADGFDDPAAGIGAGLLARPLGGGGYDVWYTCIPDLWRLSDADGDGVAEARERHSTGYGVRVALLGHDSHGLAIGHDGRLYFSIGDRGFHVVTREGRTLAHPHTGAVLRCELDGANLEVYCTGLRNPQELVFDDRGDLFTGDNNSDGGDQARWTWLLEGSDTGWRQAYQWCNDVHVRGPWNVEGLWKPFHAEQPAYVLPPIANFTSGPSGLTLYPGTGFGPEWAGTFFLCDFRGAPGYSGVHAFKNVPRGAGFALAEAREFLWNCLPTDVDFGFDGNLYTVDWVDGWNQTGKGRVYRMAPATRDEAEAARVRDVQRLMQGELAALENPALVALFDHPDRRVRLEAQLTLADRALAASDPEAAFRVLFDALRLLRETEQPVRARCHAAWLVGHVGRRNPAYAANFGLQVIALLSDPEPELRAQGAKVVGALGIVDAAEWVELLLEDSDPRVRLFAAEAAGGLGGSVNAVAVLALLQREGATDPWIRHACVRALERIGDVGFVHQHLAHESAHVRQGLAVVLRRWQDPAVAALLDDPASAVAREAADAIHGARIASAMPALAEFLARARGQHEYTLRRAIDANRVVGGADAALRLARFAIGAEGTPELRAEAVRVLSRWVEPRTRDLVIQDRWPLPGRGADELATVDVLLANGLSVYTTPDPLRAAWVEFAARQDPSERATSALAHIALGASSSGTPPAEPVRLAALDALTRRDEATAIRVATELADALEGDLRSAALAYLGRSRPELAVETLLASIMEGRDVGSSILALGSVADPSATEALLGLVVDSSAVTAPWLVEWLEAAARSADPLVVARAAELEAAFAAAKESDPLASWRMALAGGDRAKGERVFREHAAVTCTKCHKLGGEGGSEAGPDLDGVASRLSPEDLLRSVVDPNAVLAEGFQNWLVRMTDGEVFVGRVVSETPELLVLESNQRERFELATAEIAVRKRDVSAMPADTATHLSRREMRDLMAFLQGLAAR